MQLGMQWRTWARAPPCEALSTMESRMAWRMSHAWALHPMRTWFWGSVDHRSQIPPISGRELGQGGRNVPVGSHPDGLACGRLGAKWSQIPGHPTVFFSCAFLSCGVLCSFQLCRGLTCSIPLQESGSSNDGLSLKWGISSLPYRTKQYLSPEHTSTHCLPNPCIKIIITTPNNNNPPQTINPPLRQRAKRKRRGNFAEMV